MSKGFGAGLGLGIVGTIIVAIAVWITVTYTGIYNVAASDQHADAVRWTFDTTMHRSVANRAGGADLPDSFSRDLIVQGAQHYAETCAHCHGTPGGKPAEWSRGMRPEPPHLTEAATEWNPQQIHWIITNGIKMTGMPAFGPHHSREEIVALTVFVTTLPGLTADDYATLTGGANGPATERP
jgi:mono/diheme cytochrome c family protein